MTAINIFSTKNHNCRRLVEEYTDNNTVDIIRKTTKLWHFGIKITLHPIAKAL